MNMVTSMLKPFLPAYLRKKLEFGCQFEQRLDTVYLVPSLEVANERILRRIESTLQRRYNNERLFKL